jgi:tetratricopeptide (TPR) repeat protein
MFRLVWVWAVAAVASATLAGFGPALAADKVVYGPPGAWVKPAALPPASAAGSDVAAIHVLLQDVQYRIGPDGQESYGETVLRIQTPQGLQAVGNLSFAWNPEFDVLTVHKIQVIRGGQVIDLLAGGKTMTVLRRETNLERAMLDGTLSAVLQPEGLQVGDLLDMAVTVRRNDPALGGHAQTTLGTPRAAPLSRLSVRVVWPKGREVRWRQTQGLPAPQSQSSDAGEELLVQGQDLDPILRPKEAPARFTRIGEMDISDFADWSEVAALMDPLYVKAETLGASSPLRAEVAKIAAAYPDAKGRAAAALRLVQQKVRYLYLGMNDGGYVPAAADVTWQRLFGDCKGKTVLLTALLHELGIQAEPAFVSSRGGDGLDARLPMVGVFDHAIVRAMVDGKVYWLDGTRQGDRTLDELQVPPFRWALPIQGKGAALEKLVVSPLDKPSEDTVIRIDASAGLDLPAPIHVDMTLRGDGAYGLKETLDNLQPAQRDLALRESFKKTFDFVDVSKVGFVYDEGTGEVRWSMDGQARMGWNAEGKARRYEADGVGLGWKADFNREPGPGADAPFAVSYPAFAHTVETIALPHDGKGFTTAGREVDQSLGGFHMKRTIKIEKGVFTVEAISRSVTDEIPASQARAEQADLRSLAEGGVYVYAPAGYQPTEQEVARTKRAADVATLIAKGFELQQKGDLEGALAAYRQAAAEDPKSSLALADVGALLSMKGQAAEAKEDYEAALKLNPREGVALMGLGELHAAKGENDDAMAAMGQAIEIDPQNANFRRVRSVTYLGMGRLKDAEADAQKSIELDPKSAWNYSVRSRVRITQGRLDEALADNSTALKLDPRLAAALSDRGEIFLRKNQPKEALEALDKALAVAPKDVRILSLHMAALTMSGQSARYQAEVDHVLSLDPNNVSALGNKAKILLDQGDRDGAIAMIDKVVARSPKSPQVLELRAQYLTFVGRRADAVKDLDAAIAIQPSEDIYLLRATTRPKDQRKAALDDIDQAKALAPGSAAPWVTKALLAQEDHDDAAVISASDEALKLKPDELNALTLRAEALGRTGHYTDGLKDEDAGVAAHPESAQALNGRCWYRATHGHELDLALKDCEAAVRLAPGSAAILDSRGMVELRLGRYAASIADYDAALKTSPTLAASLYGRGLARLRSGDKSGADDLAAAKKASSEVETEFAGFGLKP